MKRSDLKFEEAPIFGEKQGRKAVNAKLSDLKGDNQDFETYTAVKGDIFIFPALSAVRIKKQPITKGANAAKSTIINCIRIRNGVQINSWFNVGSTGKRDVNNVKVHELFAACSDNEERVIKLCELGAIEAYDEQDITVPLFEEKPDPVTGKYKRKQKVVVDPDGVETKVDENGTQTVPMFRVYELDAEDAAADNGADE